MLVSIHRITNTEGFINAQKQNMKAIITKVSHGRKKGEFRFKLVGKNGEVIATSGSETYTQKHNVTEVLADYFSNFTVEDKTK